MQEHEQNKDKKFYISIDLMDQVAILITWWRNCLSIDQKPLHIYMGYCGYWLKHIIGYFFSALSAFTSCTLSMVAEPSFFLSEPAKLTESTPSPITTTRLFSLSIATEITPVWYSGKKKLLHIYKSN